MSTGWLPGGAPPGPVCPPLSEAHPSLHLDAEGTRTKITWGPRSDHCLSDPERVCVPCGPVLGSRVPVGRAALPTQRDEMPAASPGPRDLSPRIVNSAEAARCPTLQKELRQPLLRAVKRPGCTRVCSSLTHVFLTMSRTDPGHPSSHLIFVLTQLTFYFSLIFI